MIKFLTNPQNIKTEVENNRGRGYNLLTLKKSGKFTKILRNKTKDRALKLKSENIDKCFCGEILEKGTHLSM